MKTEFKPILLSLKHYVRSTNKLVESRRSTKTYTPIDFEKERIKRELTHKHASMLLKVYSHKQQLLNIEV